MWRSDMQPSKRDLRPVQLNDEYDVKIEFIGTKGDGVYKKHGFIVFVPHTKLGDKVRIKVIRVLENVAFAKVVEVLQ